MSRTVYKSFPRIVHIVFWLYGGLFFACLAWFIWPTDIAESKTIHLVGFGACSIVSVVLLYYSARIRTVKLTEDELIIYSPFLPIRKSFKIAEIRQLKQSEKAIKAHVWQVHFTEKSNHLYNDFTTTIVLVDGSEIVTSSVGELDFSNIEKYFGKLKRGQSKFKTPQRTYLARAVEIALDNVPGIFTIPLFVPISIALLYALFTQRFDI